MTASPSASLGADFAALHTRECPVEVEGLVVVFVEERVEVEVVQDIAGLQWIGQLHASEVDLASSERR